MTSAHRGGAPDLSPSEGLMLPHDFTTNSTPPPCAHTRPPLPSKGLATLPHLCLHPEVIVIPLFLRLILVAILNKFKKWSQWDNSEPILLLRCQKQLTSIILSIN